MLQRKSAARSKPTPSARKAALPLRTESSPSENCASGWFGTGRRAFNPASVLPDNRPAHLSQILRQFFLFPTEAYAQTLIFGPTDSYKSFVHDKTEL